MARTGDHNRRSGAASGAARPPIRSAPGGRAGAPLRQDHSSTRIGQPRQAHPQPRSRNQEIARVQGQRRRRHKRNYTLYYIMLALLLTVTGVILSLTVFFRVETIEISGTAVYTQQQVLDALDARTGDNLLRLNINRLEQDVRQRLIQAEEIQIKRRFPNTLSVEVTDAVVEKQILSGGVSYHISGGGRVVAIEQNAAPNIRIILGPDLRKLEPGDQLDRLKTLDEEAAASQETSSEEEYTNTRMLELISTLENEIERAGILDISMLDVSDSVNLKLLYQNRFEIRLGSSNELQDKLAMFSSVLEGGSLGLEEMGILDISDPDRCIASQNSPTLPDGAAQAGWKWLDSHLENFDEFFGYAGEAADQPAESGVLVGGEEQNTDGENPENTSGEEDTEPVSEPAFEDGSGESSDSADDGNTTSSPGYVMPQMPNIGGSSGAVQEPSVDESEPSSEPASDGEESGSSEPESAGSSETDPSSNTFSEPGYALPQMPQIGGG